MSTVLALCEQNEKPWIPLMEAVEEFVDSMMENAGTAEYDATARRLLGEDLSHEQIMLNIPKCFTSDLIEIHEGQGQDVTFNVSTDVRLKTLMGKLKLGRQGLLLLYKTYLELRRADDDKHKPQFYMAQAGRQMGLEPRNAQIIITKMAQRNEGVEHVIRLAEEGPTNVTGGVDMNPNGKPVKKKVCKRKKLQDEEDEKG